MTPPYFRPARGGTVIHDVDGRGRLRVRIRPDAIGEECRVVIELGPSTRLALSTRDAGALSMALSRAVVVANRSATVTRKTVVPPKRPYVLTHPDGTMTEGVVPLDVQAMQERAA